MLDPVYFYRDLMPSQATVMEQYRMLCFEQISYTMNMIFYIPESSLRSLLCPGVVLVVVIIFTLCLPPLINRAELPHLSLKDTPLTSIDVPFLIPWDVLQRVYSFRIFRVFNEAVWCLLWGCWE